MGIAMIINRPATKRKANVHRVNHLTPFVDIEVTAPANRRTTAHHIGQLSALSSRSPWKMCAKLLQESGDCRIYRYQK